MQDAQRPAGFAAGQFSRAALLAVAFAAGLPTLALAQVYDPLRGYALDGSPAPGQPHSAPRARDYPVRDDGATDGAERPHRVAVVSIKRIRRVANREGFRLATEPHRKGRSFVALAENDTGHRFELIFSAANGSLIDQRDLGPVDVATKDATPAAMPAPDGAPVAAAMVPAPAAAPAAVTSPDVAAARAEAEKAIAAAADAKKAMEASAAESRRAQAKLAEAEASARREAQARDEETRRQEARAAEQRRNEARIAEAKHRALVAAEAKLAQAKTMRERAEADMQRAETEAASARAALAPAQMSAAASKPADMVGKPTGTAANTSLGQSATAPSPSAASTMAPDSSALITMGSAKPDVPQAMSLSDGTARGDQGAEAARQDGLDKSSIKKEQQAEVPAAAASATKADVPDDTPTGSMQQSPPEPYAAPEPDASETR